MAAALPYIAAAQGIISIANSLQGPPKPPPPPPAPPTLSWDEAMKRATETLTPIYDEQMQKTLENVDKELMARGFYGQLPGDVLKGARATDVERAKAAAIASLGAQMQGQSEENALRQQQLAADWALNQSNLWNQAQRNRLSGLLGSGESLFNMWAKIGDLTGYLPTFQGPQLTSGARQALVDLGGQNLVNLGGSGIGAYIPQFKLEIPQYTNPY